MSQRPGEVEFRPTGEKVGTVKSATTSNLGKTDCAANLPMWRTDLYAQPQPLIT